MHFKLQKIRQTVPAPAKFPDKEVRNLRGTLIISSVEQPRTERAIGYFFDFFPTAVAVSAVGRTIDSGNFSDRGALTMRVTHSHLAEACPSGVRMD